MTSVDHDRTFAVATDATVMAMIRSAQRRLIVIVPALSRPVADALVARFTELGRLDIRLIVDSDPEVYRLGFGDPEALEIIRDAACRSQLDLREQSGIRIGVIVSDDHTMVFAPIPKNIEAGSDTAEKPNAVVLRGAAADNIAHAAGAQPNDDGTSGEIGNTALNPDKVDDMKKDLKQNPPTKFDIARRLRVFSSRVTYVELEISEPALSRKQVTLDEDFQTVSNKNLQKQVSSRIHAPIADIDPIKIEINSNKDRKSLDVDAAWFRKQRKQIEDKYIYSIVNYGRVVFTEDRENFTKEITQLKEYLEKYQEMVLKKISARQDEFCEEFVNEFFPKWKNTPPEYMTRYGHINELDIKRELKSRAQDIFAKMIEAHPPKFRLVWKFVSPTNLEDPQFLESLQSIMKKRRVPRHIIESLFSSGDAAPERKESP